jgi:hypothetical protein
VTVIIDQHRAARFAVDFRQRKFAKKIKATAGSLEAFQRAQDSLIVNPSSVATATAAAAFSALWRPGH